MLDIISVGDATLDVFLQMNEDDASVQCNLRKDDCQLCFTYADKIPVESVIKIPGAGNGSNNAIGSSRLSMKASMLGIVGNDDVGTSIINRWKKEGVATNFVAIDKKRDTNYSTVLNYRGERTILVFHEHRNYQFPKNLPSAKWLYYTSLGKGSEKMHTALVAYVKKNKVQLCFQPGTHQLRLGMKALKPIINASRITVVNKEEVERIVGDSTKDIKTLITRLKSLGCDIAVVTDGPRGSYTYDGKQFLRLGVFEVPVVERTGCGDAYATAFVAALHHGKTVAEAMRWGTANSASVLGYVGPQEGLLTKSKMQKMLKRFPNKPEKI